MFLSFYFKKKNHLKRRKNSFFFFFTPSYQLFPLFTFLNPSELFNDSWYYRTNADPMIVCTQTARENSVGVGRRIKNKETRPRANDALLRVTEMTRAFADWRDDDQSLWRYKAPHQLPIDCFLFLWFLPPTDAWLWFLFSNSYFSIPVARQNMS